MIGGDDLRITHAAGEITHAHLAHLRHGHLHGGWLVQVHAVRAEVEDLLVIGEIAAAVVLDGTTLRGQRAHLAELAGGQLGKSRTTLQMQIIETPDDDGEAEREAAGGDQHPLHKRTITADLALSGGRHHGVEKLLAGTLSLLATALAAGMGFR